jgi:hypothetical protein
MFAWNDGGNVIRVGIRELSEPWNCYTEIPLSG